MRDSILGTIQSSDLVINVDNWTILKNRGLDEPRKVLFYAPEADVAWLDDSLLDPSTKIYGVHWEVEEPYALWQLTAQNYLRLDVTHRFNAKYRIIAYKDVPDSEAESLRNFIAMRDIEAMSCGQEGFKGYKDDIFMFTKAPGEGYGWRVTNCAHLVPGLMQRKTVTGSVTALGDSFSKTFTTHPKDGYVVQFNAVPWDVFTRYWRKPINLNRQFHGKKPKSRWRHVKHAPSMGAPAVEVLDFDLTLLKEHKCFFADFSHMYATRTRTHDVDMAMWMLNHTRGFSILTDAESPFVREDAEVLFTLEWM